MRRIEGDGGEKKESVTDREGGGDKRMAVVEGQQGQKGHGQSVEGEDKVVGI